MARTDVRGSGNASSDERARVVTAALELWAVMDDTTNVERAISALTRFDVACSVYVQHICTNFLERSQ
jgi:hypothetical protein